MNENTVIAGNRNRLSRKNVKLPANENLHHQQHDRRHPGDQQQERHQDRQLAEDVLGPRQRLRQVDLQRVGAAVVGDQPGADIDRDEEQEDVLLVEELAERFRRRREKRGRELPQASFSRRRETFRQFLDQQQTFVFFVTVYVGAGLIANDRRANALQIYLSKPLTRAEYVFGKLAILMTFLLLVTWLPAIVLLIVQIAFAGNFTFFRNNVFLFPAITRVLVHPGRDASPRRCWRCRRCRRAAATSASSMRRCIFFTQAIYGVLYAVTRSTALSWMSFSANLTQIGDVIFRQPLQYDTPWPVVAADDRRR